MIDYDSNIEDLVKKAQLGDKDCFEQLVNLAQPRLHADIYRLTLENELTAEIVQETIVEMFKILGQLRDTQRFWPWLYRIAHNKFHLHQRKEILRKTVPISSVDPVAEGKDALANLIGDELKETIFDAMRRLKPEHRSILTMRCYREMDYNAIAESMGCSRFAAKMLFFRAKKSIGKELAKRGFGKGSFLIALALFGKMTAENSAAAAELSITASSVKVGIPISIAGTVLSTSGIVAVLTVGILGIGAVMTTYHPGEQNFDAQNQFAPVGSLSNMEKEEQSQQCWYYYPQGPGGPVMIRLIKQDSQGRGSYYVLRQNEEGNYQFDENNNTIYIRNYHLWNPDFSVRCLPTDVPKLRKFLSRVDGANYQSQYNVPYSKDGLLVIATEGVDTTDKPATVTYLQNLLDEEYFHYNLPVGAKLVDQRDEMHKRGWTYFSITGNINGESVSGRGRIPFVYATSKDYYPYLQLSVGRGQQVIDMGSKAGLYNKVNKTITTYPSGEFFRGLPRPWAGLHVIDTIRRDAAEKGLMFETESLPDASLAEVTIFYRSIRLVYTIDMENDLVDRIDFFSDNVRVGQLEFSYMQNIEAIADFAEPVLPAISVRQNSYAPGILWLFGLVETEPVE